MAEASVIVNILLFQQKQAFLVVGKSGFMDRSFEAVFGKIEIIGFNLGHFGLNAAPKPHPDMG